MSMSFWDTVRGHELADTLIRELPKIKMRKKTEQYTVLVHSPSEQVALELSMRKVQEEIKKGNRYLSELSGEDPIHQYSHLLIFEKEV